MQKGAAQPRPAYRVVIDPGSVAKRQFRDDRQPHDVRLDVFGGLMGRRADGAEVTLQGPAGEQSVDSAAPFFLQTGLQLRDARELTRAGQSVSAFDGRNFSHNNHRFLKGGR